MDETTASVPMESVRSTAPRGRQVDSSKRVYVLELFCANGRVGAFGNRVVGECGVVTVDDAESSIDGRVVPKLTAKLPDDNHIVVDYCKKAYPDKVPIVWASLREWLDMEHVDANILAVRDIARALDAVLVVITSCSSVGLVGRDVMTFLPFSNEVAHCKYGHVDSTWTTVWCSHDLCAHGLRPRTCNNDCTACVQRDGVTVHAGDLLNRPRDRLLPVGAVVSVFNAAIAFVESTMRLD
jgi:hypothetical protein